MGVTIFIILCAHRFVYRLCQPDSIPVTMDVYSSRHDCNYPFLRLSVSLVINMFSPS